MKDNNTLIKVISFLFPPIGLIIFAINIDKNNALAKMSVKYALLGIVIIPLSIFIILTILYSSYTNKVNEIQKSTIKVPVASVYIGTMERITEDMIDYVDIPKSMIKDTLIIDSKDIIGKYTSHSCSVPQGAMFYDNCLTDTYNDTDTKFESIRDGYILYAYPLNFNDTDTYSNYLSPNDNIDLYYINYDNKIYSKLLSNIKIFDITNEKILIEIPTNIFNILRNESINKYLKIIPVNVSITTENGYKEVSIDDLLNYLQSSPIT